MCLEAGSVGVLEVLQSGRTRHKEGKCERGSIFVRGGGAIRGGSDTGRYAGIVLKAGRTTVVT